MTTSYNLVLSVFGAAKTVYSNILAKGREAQFSAGTPIELQLAPGPPGPQCWTHIRGAPRLPPPGCSAPRASACRRLDDAMAEADQVQSPGDKAANAS